VNIGTPRLLDSIIYKRLESKEGTLHRFERGSIDAVGLFHPSQRAFRSGLSLFLCQIHRAGGPIEIVDSMPDLFGGLLSAPFDFSEGPIHNDELFPRIARIATIRYGNYRREKNQKLIPATSLTPRLFKSRPLVHVLTFVCFLLCFISLSAFIWSLVQGLSRLIMFFGFASLINGIAFGIALSVLDRITLNS